MRKNFAIAATGFGLALLCASQSFAGTTGNGWSQSRATAGLPSGGAQTQYVFCYGANPNTAYFSPVFTAASTKSIPDLGVAYGHYLTQTGYRTNGGQCIHAAASADASAEKMRRESELRAGRKIMEISWSGN